MAINLLLWLTEERSKLNDPWLTKTMNAAVNLNARSVGEIMTAQVLTVEMDDSLEAIRDIFKKVPFHHLLVVENNKLAGVISDRDYLKAISPYVGTLSETSRDRDTLSRRAHQIMSHYPVTVRCSCPLQEAAKLMLLRGVSCLPVTTVENVILGVVTWKDIFNAFLEPTPLGTHDSGCSNE